MIYAIKIGQVLKRVLKEQRKTLKEVSEETSIPYSTLHTWLENRQPKDIVKAQVLAKYFSISLEELLFDQIPVRKYKNQEIVPTHGFELSEGRFEVIVKKLDRV